MNIIDLSNRRGAIVHMLPNVYDLLKKDGHDLPNIIIWTQSMKKAIIDINRKWIFATISSKDVQGMMFYRMGTDGKSLYIDTLSGSPKTVEALLKKFEQNDLVKARENFFISRYIKREEADEVLETVGLQDDSVYDEEGYYMLGGLNEVISALKIRYLR